MYPADFPESNFVLDAFNDYEVLSVCITNTTDDIPVVVSCWKVTQEELDNINKTGRVWLMVAGSTMLPATVSGTNPFE